MDSSQLPQSQENLTKRERKLLRRQERESQQQRTETKRSRKRALWRIIGVIILVGIGWIILLAIRSQSDIPPDEVISKNGIHWHAKLKIAINGKEEPIPAGIGIGAVHNPVHTHDPDNTIHLEFQGRVTKDDLKLSEFFKVWKKEFNANCIFSSEGGSASGGEYCNGPEGTMKMLVNGQQNTEFADYQMKDKDEIVVRYE